ncbi:MAG TPA: methyl-accepting chemotaxis protein, partial [Gammaproteobacteria bacterium]
VEQQSDLTRRVRSPRDDELGRIGHAIDRMLEKFQHSLQEAASASQALLQGTKNLRQVSEKTSVDTDIQKDTTAQLAVAMQELVQTLEHIAMNVSRTSEAADGTRQQTQESSARASAVMRSIQELTNGIRNSSDIVRDLNGKATAIGTVLDVIRGIAEQTNLLALNAAIEAARAGEQGRGFAVVADEVRMLATRTQDSTREIQDIITQLQQGAEAAVVAMGNDCNRAAAGVTETTKAMTANEQAAVAVTAITDLITQIAAATEQQHVTAEEINRNLVNINRIAEQTAVGAATNSSVSAGIEATAHRLDAAVKVFKLS